MGEGQIHDQHITQLSQTGFGHHGRTYKIETEDSMGPAKSPARVWSTNESHLSNEKKKGKDHRKKEVLGYDIAMASRRTVSKWGGGGKGLWGKDSPRTKIHPGKKKKKKKRKGHGFRPIQPRGPHKKECWPAIQRPAGQYTSTMNNPQEVEGSPGGGRTERSTIKNSNTMKGGKGGEGERKSYRGKVTSFVRASLEREPDLGTCPIVKKERKEGRCRPKSG